MQFGLFLNNGAFPDLQGADVFALTLEQAWLAECLGYEEVWVTEHHFIDYGICPSALTLASFLLGRTERIRVGTAVVLAPLQHPVALSEQVALLDQLSGGRFDLGLGRGGYLRDYEVLGVPTMRWTAEVDATLEAVVDALSNDPTSSANGYFPYDSVRVLPRPLTRPHPPIYVASSSPSSVDRAAQLGLPLQFHFGTDIPGRVAVIERYNEAAIAAGRDPAQVTHMHAVLCHVEDHEADAREAVRQGLEHSYSLGDHPSVMHRASRAHADISREERVAKTVAASPIGPPDLVQAWFKDFIDQTGASNIALYMEAIGDAPRTLASVHAFAELVRPHLSASKSKQDWRPH